MTHTFFGHSPFPQFCYSASALEQNAIDDVDASATWEVPEEIEELRPGTKLAVQVSVLEASGLPLAYSHNLFCQYKFWGQDDSLIIPPLIPPSGQEPSTRDNIHRFNDRRCLVSSSKPPPAESRTLRRCPHTSTASAPSSTYSKNSSVTSTPNVCVWLKR